MPRHDRRTPKRSRAARRRMALRLAMLDARYRNRHPPKHHELYPPHPLEQRRYRAIITPD